MSAPMFTLALHDKNGKICFQPVPVKALPLERSPNNKLLIPFSEASWKVRWRSKTPTGYVLFMDGAEYYRGRIGSVPIPPGICKRSVTFRIADLTLTLIGEVERACPLGGRWEGGGIDG